MGPFQLAIALTVLALVLILAFFDENVGGRDVTRPAVKLACAGATVASPRSSSQKGGPVSCFECGCQLNLRHSRFSLQLPQHSAGLTVLRCERIG